MRLSHLKMLRQASPVKHLAPKSTRLTSLSVGLTAAKTRATLENE
jgi:hypothetical protein